MPSVCACEQNCARQRVKQFVQLLAPHTSIALSNGRWMLMTSDDRTRTREPSPVDKVNRFCPSDSAPVHRCPLPTSGTAHRPVTMGGDHGHGFDTKMVWTPSGGWYPDPKGWRRNTALVVGAIAVASYFIASTSAKLEVRAHRKRQSVGLSRCLRFSDPGGSRAARSRACLRRDRGWIRRAGTLWGVLECLCIREHQFLTPTASVQQRPLAPVRPIPSQRWCDNFPAEAKQ